MQCDKLPILIFTEPHSHSPPPEWLFLFLPFNLNNQPLPEKAVEIVNRAIHYFAF